MRLVFMDQLWLEVHDHMNNEVERASFFFTKSYAKETWNVEESWMLNDDQDYSIKTGEALQLNDQVRPQVISHAHRNGYAVVEAHSHYWSGKSTQFSSFDLMGLAEFAPHMLWRLPNRPYISLVIGVDSFDALVWTPGNIVQKLNGLSVGSQLLHPTDLSFHPFLRQTSSSK